MAWLKSASFIANGFNKIYATNKCYYGIKPCEELLDLVRTTMIPTGLALDLGAGEGRDSIFLAENGFSVIAIDLAKTGLMKLKKGTRERNLHVETIVCDARNIDFPKGTFNIIVTTTLLNHFDSNEQRILLVENIRKWLKEGGFVFAEVFTVDDPGFKNPRSASECAKFVNSYYGKGELMNDFSAFELRYYAEKIEYDDFHGVPHYHGAATLIAKKIGSSNQFKSLIKTTL